MENLQLCLHDPAQFCGRGIPVIHADASTATGDHLMCPYADAALHRASHGSPFLHNDVSSEVLSVVQPEHNKQSSTFSLLHTDHHHCLYTFYMHRILVFVKYFDVDSSLVPIILIKSSSIHLLLKRLGFSLTYQLPPIIPIK